MPRWSSQLWLATFVAGSLLVAVALAVYPWFALGIGVGGLLLLMTVIRPLAVIGVLLAIGAADLSFLTGGYRNLLPGLGGLDMNGIRLVGVVVGFSAAVLVDREMRRHAFERYGRWFMVFLTYAAVTLIWSASPFDGSRLLFKLAYPFVVFLAVLGIARTEGQLTRLADWTLAAAAVIALIVNPLLVLAGGYEVDIAGRIRVSGIGLGHNPFSFYMLIMMLLAFGRYSVRGEVRYLVLCGVFGVWVALTLTRISLLAGLAGIGGMAIFAVVQARNYRALATAALIVLGAAFFMVPTALERSLGTVPSLPELWETLGDPVAFFDMINLQGREVVWALGFQQFLSSPFVGNGLGSSTDFMLTALPFYGAVVHNEYLRLAMETGLLGNGLFAIAIGSWWLAIMRTGRVGSPLAQEFTLPAAGAIVAWTVISATDNAFDYYGQFTQYVGFLCAGALVAASLANGRRVPAESAVTAEASAANMATPASLDDRPGRGGKR